MAMRGQRAEVGLCEEPYHIRQQSRGCVKGHKKSKSRGADSVNGHAWSEKRGGTV